MFFVQGFSPLQLAILLPPIAILLANYVQYLRKRWTQEMMLYIVLAVFVVFEMGVL
jgi:ATP/ADP translocase